MSASVLRSIGIRPQRGERVLLGLDFLPSLTVWKTKFNVNEIILCSRCLEC